MKNYKSETKLIENAISLRSLCSEWTLWKATVGCLKMNKIGEQIYKVIDIDKFVLFGGDGQELRNFRSVLGLWKSLTLIRIF